MANIMTIRYLTCSDNILICTYLWELHVKVVKPCQFHTLNIGVLSSNNNTPTFMYICTSVKIKIYSKLMSDNYIRGVEGLEEGGLTRYFQQYFSYIVAVSFIGGGNRSTRIENNV